MFVSAGYWRLYHLGSQGARSDPSMILCARLKRCGCRFDTDGTVGGVSAIGDESMTDDPINMWPSMTSLRVSVNLARFARQ